MERIVVCTTEGGFPAIDTMVLLTRGEGAQAEWEATCDPESLFEGTFGPPGDGLWIWEGDPIWNEREGRWYFNKRFEWRRPTSRELPALAIGASPWTPTIGRTYRCVSCGAGFVMGGKDQSCVECRGSFRKVPCNCDENCDEPFCPRHDWDRFVENWGSVDEALEQLGWK